MEEMIFFDNAKDNITNFFEKEFPNFPPLLMSHFLNKFNDLLNYTEEDDIILKHFVDSLTISKYIEDNKKYPIDKKIKRTSDKGDTP